MSFKEGIEVACFKVQKAYLLTEMGTTSHNSADSLELGLELFTNLNDDGLAPFRHNKEFYMSRGVEMYRKLMEKFEPTDLNSLNALEHQLTTMRMGANEGVDTFLARIHTINRHLARGGRERNEGSLTHFAIQGLDPVRYSKIKDSYEQDLLEIKSLEDLSKRLNNFDLKRGSRRMSDCGQARAATVTGPTAASDIYGKSELDDAEVSNLCRQWKCHLHRTNKHSWVQCPFLRKNWNIERKQQRSGQLQQRSKPASVLKPPSMGKASAVATVSPTTNKDNPDSESESVIGSEFCYDYDTETNNVSFDNDSNAELTKYLAFSPVYRVCQGSIRRANSPPVSCSTMIVDSGATCHMIPDRDAFTNYEPIKGGYVLLADQSRVPCVGIGTVVIAIQGHIVTISNCRHVPCLRAPLLSIRQHRRNQGCTFIADNKGCILTFPTFFVEIDDVEDCAVAYKSIGDPLVCSEFDDRPSDVQAAVHQTRAVLTRAAAKKTLQQSPLSIMGNQSVPLTDLDDHIKKLPTSSTP
ncbi:MAG: hypothetical protein ACREOZ_01040, partial [Gloeomargaritales cyanobacterium]